MVITVYIEFFFIINFFMNYIVILLTDIILNRKSKKRHMAAFIAAIIYCLILLIGKGKKLCMPMAGVICPMVAAVIVLEKPKIKELIKYLTGIYISTFFLGIVMGGIISHTYIGYLFINLLKRSSEIVTMGIFLCYAYILFKIVIKGIISLRMSLYKQLKNCNIILKYNDMVIKTIGLIDSGNNLYFGENKHPVSIVEYRVIKELLKEQPKGLFTVEYKSSGNDEGMLFGIVFDEMILDMPQKEIVISNPHVGIYKGILSSKGEYGMIIHKDYLKEI